MSALPDATVFVVDDDEELRSALALLMRTAGLHAEAYASALDFLSALDGRSAGCIVLDIRMPGMSGMDLLAELQKRRSPLPVIFLTGHGDVPLAVKAMKSGAADFILKPLDQHRLVMAVMSALRTNAETLAADAAPPIKDAGGPLSLLSRREREVVERLVQGRSSRDIAEELCISLKTVEFHRANIREKLGAANLADLVRLVLQS
jgi:two-component system, LuxR family, response regulator FixJ